MKIALILLCLVCTAIQPAFANDTLILEVTGARKSENSNFLEEGSFIEQKIQFAFNNDNGVFLLGNERGSILFKIEDMERLRSLFEKYMNWEKLAISNMVKIYKDIPESVFSTEIVYDTTSRGDYIKESVHFKMSFYSVSENEHLLVIDSGSLEKNGFSFLDEPLYLNNADIQKIYSSIKEEEIEHYIEEYRNKEKIKELFK